MSRPSSMSRIGSSPARASPRPGRATGRCWPGCAPSGSSSASASKRPAPTARGCCATCRHAGVEVLEVTAPDKQDRRRRGKNDDLDAQNAAHAAFAGKRTVTPKSRDGMIEALRVLKACRKTAVAARRVALQMIHNTIVCAPEELRDTLRRMTRMQLVRTLAAWRPDLTDYRNTLSAYRIALKSLARRYLELHDEIADLDDMIGAIVDELAPDLVARNSIGHGSAAQLLLTAGDNPERLRLGGQLRRAVRRQPGPRFIRQDDPPSPEPRRRPGGQQRACTSSPSVGSEPTNGQRPTSPGASPTGHSKLEAIRCLKRYIAREVFTLHQQTPTRDQPGPIRRLTLRRASAGSQYVSIKYTERLAEAGIEPSVGSVGDSYDNALAETINRPLQDRGDPPARAVAQPRGRRVRHARMGRLVQPPPPARAHRQHPARRGRSTLLRRTGDPRLGGVTQTKPPPGNPARFSPTFWMEVRNPARPTTQSCAFRGPASLLLNGHFQKIRRDPAVNLKRLLSCTGPAFTWAWSGAAPPPRSPPRPRRRSSAA